MRGPESTSLPMDFFFLGAGCTALEGEMVCPAWMVPPTEAEIPLLLLGSQDVEMTFNAKKLTYSLKHLAFNQDPKTPMIVKMIDDSFYMVLMREHLFFGCTCSFAFFLYVMTDTDTDTSRMKLT